MWNIALATLDFRSNKLILKTNDKNLIMPFSSPTVAAAFRNYDLAASQLQDLIMNPSRLAWNNDRRVLQVGSDAIQTIRELRNSRSVRSDLIIMRVDACTDAALECIRAILEGAEVEEASEEQMQTAMRNISRRM